MDSAEQSYPILSFCTGFRGIETALESLSQGTYKPIAYVEIEAFAIFNLVKQMEENKLVPVPIWSNLKTFPAKEFHRKVFGITGGYPCQPFSIAGAKKGTEDPRHLWPFIERSINTIRPVFGFFENVDRHLSDGFDTVYQSLSKLGYAVETGIFTAEEVGAPHKRKRLFILAIDKLGYAQHVRQIKRSIVGSPGKAYEKPPTECKDSQQFKRTDKPSKRGGVSAKELADSNNNGHCNHSKKVSGKASTDEIKTQERKRIRPRSGSIGNNEHKWPARFGQPQYQHEPSRSISEPSLGLLADGYNTHEDIMRLLGNGVVWQQAAKAFEYILQKHEANINHPINA